jgi:hypothetical protein
MARWILILGSGLNGRRLVSRCRDFHEDSSLIAAEVSLLAGEAVRCWRRYPAETARFAALFNSRGDRLLASDQPQPGRTVPVRAAAGVVLPACGLMQG